VNHGARRKSKDKLPKEGYKHVVDRPLAAKFFQELILMGSPSRPRYHLTLRKTQPDPTLVVLFVLFPVKS
jgi:hypothetical protein